MKTDERITKLTLVKDGPILVHGAISYIGEEEGKSLDQAKPLALCRCGQSSNKPFCDGSHREAEQGLPQGEIE